jgi:hypothetical protein
MSASSVVSDGVFLVSSFAEEHMPVPEFTGNHRMASLIAYLHSGGPSPEVMTGVEQWRDREHMGGE